MSEPNHEPGRNEPCPCGKVDENGIAVKYKHCCGDADLKALREDYIRMKILAHLFLTQLHQLTGKPAVAVADETLKNYPAAHKIKLLRDRVQGLFLFTAELPPEPVIEAPRRIILAR
jgi:hypothetical protein